LISARLNGFVDIRSELRGVDADDDGHVVMIRLNGAMALGAEKINKRQQESDN